MTVSAAIKKHPRKLIHHLVLLMFLGWLVLLLWSFVTWGYAGYPAAQTSLQTLVEKQSHAVVFFKPHVISLKLKAPIGAIENPDLRNLILELSNKAAELTQLLMLSAQCMLMKLLMLITSIPLFTITLLAGLVDGLSQRAIRTACLGRESSYMFHQLTRYSKRGLVLFLALWFLVPLNITPAYVFIPMSVFVGVMTAMTASRFKKYW
jgi:integrating conjugative element membrane protein (TIGR03747 family)